ncbi:MAG: lysophospholipase L1-like esterase [Planctomycetota bacterium]|jgi:lysophospholipase L1-like esterase
MNAPPADRPPRSPRKGYWALGAMVCGAVLFALSWNDVLPGGWTLRGWVEPHASREARVRQIHSQKRLDLFAGQNRSAPTGSIVFAGSSGIERFPLARLFPGAPTQNRGIGDEACGQFMDRLQATRPFAPAAAWVLYLGSLDFRRLNSTPEEVLQRVERAIEAVRGDRTDLPIALIGILPEQDMPEAMVTRLAQTNAGLARLCARMEVAFVDTARAPITQPDGTLSATHASDKLHLNRKGYDALAGWLLEASLPIAKLLQAN